MRRPKREVVLREKRAATGSIRGAIEVLAEERWLADKIRAKSYQMLLKWIERPAFCRALSLLITTDSASWVEDRFGESLCNRVADWFEVALDMADTMERRESKCKGRRRANRDR